MYIDRDIDGFDFHQIQKIVVHDSHKMIHQMMKDHTVMVKKINFVSIYTFYSTSLLLFVKVSIS